MKSKHPPKVNVWAGISRRGATRVVIFTGILTAIRYVDILKNGLLPFLEAAYPDGHRYMQDNDPKHTSRYAQWWYENNEINWWKTPASSPDLNPIELIWHTLKEFVQTSQPIQTKTRYKNILGITNSRNLFFCCFSRHQLLLQCVQCTTTSTTWSNNPLSGKSTSQTILHLPPI